MNWNYNLTTAQVLLSSAQDDSLFQVLWNGGKKCNGMKAKLNRQTLAELNGSAESVRSPSFLISNILEIHFPHPVLALQTPHTLQAVPQNLGD